jgi:hypothetical protein
MPEGRFFPNPQSTSTIAPRIAGIISFSEGHSKFTIATASNLQTAPIKSIVALVAAD